ncbi:MAG: hypothetical protein J1F11_10065 [Oscillospiraceae bacterium]|nr:hypothetical protein [Oscillospiraceae bacterium]
MKMSSNDIKKLYKEHMERSAPDMDALWEKIENGLETKTENGVTSQPVRKRLSTPALKWAVCAAALLIIPISVRIVNNSSGSKDLGLNMAQTNDGANMKDGAAGASYDSAEDAYVPDHDFIAESPANDIEMPESVTADRSPVYYEELFPYSSESTVPAPSGATSGDDFFVEENVLVETDVIVNAYIDRVYSKGDTVCYEITAENAETLETETLVIESATPYTMKEAGSYLLPLKIENGEYRLVFENAPQIEFAENGGLIFHNGWSSLDSSDTVEVIYPQSGIDDFFYDRMKFSYSADISPLLDEWNRVKQT